MLWQRLFAGVRYLVQEAIRHSILEIQQLRERIKEDQIDIEQSRGRTEAMLARLKVR